MTVVCCSLDLQASNTFAVVLPVDALGLYSSARLNFDCMTGNSDSECLTAWAQHYPQMDTLKALLDRLPYVHNIGHYLVEVGCNTYCADPVVVVVELEEVFGRKNSLQVVDCYNNQDFALGALEA